MIDRRKEDRRQTWVQVAEDRRHADRRSSALALDELIAGMTRFGPDIFIGPQQVPELGDPIWLAAQGDWDAFVKGATS